MHALFSLRRSLRKLPFLPYLEELEKRDLPSTVFTVTTTGDPTGIAGTLSLRQAILQANATVGPVIIQFQIAGSINQVFTIAPLSALPALTNEVLIDGTSQQAFNGGTIELTGNSVKGAAPGLTLNASNCGVQGLVINDFVLSAGIFIGSGASNCVIQNDRIGTDTTGSVAAGNLIGVEVLGPGNTIGGVTPAARNVVSGNSQDGVRILGGSAVGNIVEGNFIGTTADGLAALPNGTGVSIESRATQNIVGGTTSGAGNLISGNTGSGVFAGGVSDVPPAFHNTIEGNFIGTDISGTQSLGNRGDGITLESTTHNTVNGNVVAANGGNGILIHDIVFANSSFSDFNLVQGNFIGTDLSATLSLPNNGDGVRVDGSLGNQILANSIFLDGGIGIDLINGGNNLQPAPSIDSVTDTNGSVTITWSLVSPNTPNTPFHLEFFSSSVADPSGSGPGQFFLTSISVTTDNGGQAKGTLVLSGLSASAPFLTATATDMNGANTSQFSAAAVLPLADLAVTTSVDNPAPLVGQTIQYTVTVTNNGGPDNATGVSLSHVLPSGLAFVSAQASQGSFDASTWSVGSLAVNASATLTITATVLPGTENTALSDQAIVTVADQFDPNPANNRAQVTVTPVIDSFETTLPGTVPLPTIAPQTPPAPADVASPLALVLLQDVPVTPSLPSAELVQVLESDTVAVAAEEIPAQELPPEQVAAVITLLFAPHEQPTPNRDPLAEAEERNEARTGMITGAVFVDVNADGIWQVGEPPLEGMRVFLDLTGTGAFDATKPVAVTDNDGQYHFDGLAPGLYTVRLVPHSLYSVTAPLGGLAQVRVVAGKKVSITFGCKPLRPRHDGEDADARPRRPGLAPNVSSREDAQLKARDTLFSNGDGSPWLSGAALIGLAASGLRGRTGLRRTSSDRVPAGSPSFPHLEMPA
jgi:uncharacterized repeat protein (TIGR01451 family)